MSIFDWFRSDPAPTPPAAPVPVFGNTAPVIAVPVTRAPADTPSEACIALIEREEGCILTSKRDVDGVFVLGYGNKLFDGKPVAAGQTTDHAGADRNCRVHAQVCATAVQGAVKVPLLQGQLDSLTDFVYNVGLGGLLQSTLLRTINARQPVTQAMFTVWNKEHLNGVVVINPGLTNRRVAEYQLFIS